MNQWILAHRKSILTYSICLFAGVFSICSIYNKIRPYPEKEYLLTETYFNKWTSANHHDEELFQKLEKMMAKHPELHAKYDALIAERFLIWNEPKRASSYFIPALKRVESESAYYPQFAKINLLIAEGDLRTALEDARDLFEEMNSDDSLFTKKTMRWEGLLYAFNLVQMAMLEKEVGTLQGEIKAWRALVALEEKDAEAFSMVQAHFRKNNLSLFDYMNHRQSMLSLKENS